MSAALQAVQSMYTQATQHLNMMLIACHDEDEQDEVWGRYYELRKNFDDCVNQRFEEDDAELMQLEADAAAVAAKLAKIDEQLGNIGKVLDTLATAVDYGVMIVAKVITL